MIRVLFVCMGNICRSPMAEALFQHMVNEAGLGDQFMIDSAGTSGYHVGEKAHVGTRNVLNKNHIPYDGRSRQFAREDVQQFDYILAMDYDNLAGMRRIAGGKGDDRLHMFLSFANDAGLTTLKEVPDPYYDGKFDEVYALVKQGAQALLNHIRQQKGL